MTKIIFGFNVVNPIDIVSYIDCPILFIHEEYDEFIPAEDVRRLFRASPSPVNELWEISGVEHSQAYRSSPDVFITKVTNFFKTNA
jgi:pimeloyl-ACP methyl ester carboxylesterase